MKIGILTLPLGANLGGIVQAYALSTVLKKMGHAPFIIANKADKSFKDVILYDLSFWINTYIKRNNKFSRQKFIRKYIPLRSEKSLYREIKKHTLDAVVVGSDQVWRPIYAKPVERYFLDFLESNHSIRKIAYAASFGTSNWEYTLQQTVKCSNLLKQFDLITVREDSGVNLCKNYLHAKAIHVLDPTMLLSKEEYIDIIEKERIPKFNGNLFTYILDTDNCKRNFIDQIVKRLNKIPFTMMSCNQLYDYAFFPGVPFWLRGFMDAEFVITDSFHGCVFSIIFNKPFIALGNKERGQSRFESLLKIFNLQDRLIDIGNPNVNCIFSPINWTNVNSIMSDMKKVSTTLLINALK